MSRDVVLSSEQALDDYFAALLDESGIDLELVQEKSAESASQLPQNTEVVPQLQKQQIEQTEPESPESYILPNLEDVQRLLNQLETTNPVDDIEDIEKLLDKNTDKIALQIQESEATAVVSDKVESVVEEIQDWDISVQSDEVIDMKTEVAEPEVEEKVTEPEIQTEPITPVAEPQPDLVAEDVDVPFEQVAHGEDTQSEPLIDMWKNVERQERFQILYFEVNGVMFAVPLDQLGGIHRLETLNHLIGRPSWYLGLQTNRDNQLDVVDTACWVMADKLSDTNYKSAYQYIVMLGDSSWGLACDHLKGTELLDSDKVRWREKAGKRPWLAGMVKERMCALIHVEALIGMLSAGLDVKALDN